VNRGNEVGSAEGAGWSSAGAGSVVAEPLVLGFSFASR
jgi:hypothetical protein